MCPAQNIPNVGVIDAHSSSQVLEPAYIVFDEFAERATRCAGRPRSFVAALLLVGLWAAVGPMMHFGNGWQLIINTGTTIVVFPMSLLIQRTQSRRYAEISYLLDLLIEADLINRTVSVRS